MLDKLTLIDKKLRGKSPLGFFVIISLAMYLPIIIFFPLLYFAPREANIPLAEGMATSSAIVLLLICAPLLETLIFQFAVIEIGEKIPKIKTWIVILASAILFGLIHYPNYKWQIVTFFCGILLAYSYVVYKDIYQGKWFPAFVMVTLLHSARNIPAAIMAVIGSNFFQKLIGT